jgi:hypothetical protein
VPCVPSRNKIQVAYTHHPHIALATCDGMHQVFAFCTPVRVSVYIVLRSTTAPQILGAPTRLGADVGLPLLVRIFYFPTWRSRAIATIAR